MSGSLDTGLASYTVDETRTLLRVGRTTLYEAIERNEVPSFKIGTALRVPGWWVRKQLEEPVAA